MVSNVDCQFIESNGIKLHVACAGPEDGPVVILLHGFPEFWYGWRHQIPALASAGYRVLAPDQRGYNLSDKPLRIGSYAIDQLAQDVVGLIHWTGRRKAYVVGHDWGAAVAWWLAIHCSPAIERLVVLNVPHPAVMLRHLRGNLKQILRSWYIVFFQLPWLPETLAGIGNWHRTLKALQSTGRLDAFTDDDLEFYRQAWSQPRAFRSMVNWYRALFRTRSRIPADSKIRVPTLLIWGAQDRFLGREMAQPSIELCEQGKLVMIEEATHWVHHEEAQQVNNLITEFLSD